MYTFGVIIGVLLVFLVFGTWKLLGKIFEWLIMAIAFVFVAVRELVNYIKNS